MNHISYTQNHSIFMPEVKIETHDASYVYVPLRGYCSLLAVFDIQDNCIGWIDTRTLGYETAKDWIVGTNWIDQGY
jgi:hypothetical protein